MRSAITVLFLAASGATAAAENNSPRIVSLAPSLTESLVFVGARAQLVGRTRFCAWPRGDVESIPIVGGMADPELETLLSLQPDLVVATEMTPRPVAQRLEALGLRVTLLPEHGVDGIFADLTKLAQLAGVDATKPIETLRARLERVRSIVVTIVPADRPRVLVLFGLDGLHSAATGTFSSGIIEAAGGENVVRDTASSWPTLALEQIAVWNPDVIFVTADHPEQERSTGTTIADLPHRPVWESLRAVQNRKVLLLGDSVLSIPGPRTIAAIERLAQVLHPERFGGDGE